MSFLCNSDSFGANRHFLVQCKNFAKNDLSLPLDSGLRSRSRSRSESVVSTGVGVGVGVGKIIPTPTPGDMGAGVISVPTNGR